MQFRFLLILAVVFALIVGWTTQVFAQETAHGAGQEAALEAGHGGEEHHTLPLKPAELLHIGPFTITNSMMVTWFVGVGIILLAQLATRKIKPVPTGLQNFWEWMVESLHNFLESMIGRDLVKKTFWFFATVFIFILCLNWFGLIPGVGTIGWGHQIRVADLPSRGRFSVARMRI